MKWHFFLYGVLLIAGAFMESYKKHQSSLKRTPQSLHGEMSMMNFSAGAGH
jgi:hypothetical protein